MQPNIGVTVAKSLFKRFLSLALLGLILLCQSTAWAESYPQKPPSKDFFVDEANLINEADRKTINNTAAALLSQEQIPLFVVTIPSLSSYQSTKGIEAYAQALFDHWGIGFKDRNYGILLLISKGDRKARIEFGKSWDHRHDHSANEIMQGHIIPAFKRDDYSGGITAGVTALDAIARGLALPKPKLPPWAIPAMILSVIGVIGIAYSLFKSGRKGWGWAFLAIVGLIIFMVLKNAGRASGSGGGFGGGSSGGGGATGSW